MASVSAYLRHNVLGLVAIFLALNAGAYAVTTTEDDSAKTVFNQDLANSSVDSRVLAAGAVAGQDIQAAAVGPKKLKLDCRQQRRDVLEFLTGCARATHEGANPPSLVSMPITAP